MTLGIVIIILPVKLFGFFCNNVLIYPDRHSAGNRNHGFSFNRPIRIITHGPASGNFFQKFRRNLERADILTKALAYLRSDTIKRNVSQFKPPSS